MGGEAAVQTPSAARIEKTALLGLLRRDAAGARGALGGDVAADASIVAALARDATPRFLGLLWRGGLHLGL